MLQQKTNALFFETLQMSPKKKPLLNTTAPLPTHTLFFSATTMVKKSFVASLGWHNWPYSGFVSSHAWEKGFVASLTLHPQLATKCCPSSPSALPCSRFLLAPSANQSLESAPFQFSLPAALNKLSAISMLSQFCIVCKIDWLPPPF